MDRILSGLFLLGFRIIPSSWYRCTVLPTLWCCQLVWNNMQYPQNRPLVTHKDSWICGILQVYLCTTYTRVWVTIYFFIGISCKPHLRGEVFVLRQKESTTVKLGMSEPALPNTMPPTRHAVFGDQTRWSYTESVVFFVFYFSIFFTI